MENLIFCGSSLFIDYYKLFHFVFECHLSVLPSPQEKQVNAIEKDIKGYLHTFHLYLGTGLAAVFINISVENFAGWKYSLTFDIIQKSYLAGFLVYMLINLALVLSSAYIITNFAPAAAGSGIPEIKGYLNGKL